MPHPSHGNINKYPVILRRNKTCDPPASCQVSCFLKLLQTSQTMQFIMVVSRYHEPVWCWWKRVKKAERDLKHRDTVVPCRGSKSRWATHRLVPVPVFMAQTLLEVEGVRKAAMSSLPASASVNLADRGACLWMCACEHFTSLCFAWYF